MEISLCRVDNRLLHGQVTASWTRKNGISRIFVVDDELCKDELASKVLMFASPTGVSTGVYSIDQMVHILNQRTFIKKDAKIALLFKTVHSVREFFEKTGKVHNVITIGGLTSRIGRQEVLKNLFLSQEEQDELLKLIRKYEVQIEFQVLPSDPKIDLGEVLKKKNG